jgi:hypothetical protein
MKKSLLLASLAALTMIPLAGFAAEKNDVGANDIGSLIKNGKPYADLRYRYEQVDQDPFTKDAKASTLRTKLGFQTGTWQNLQGQLEFEMTSHLGNNTYNDGINGHTAYPAVTDPINHELNQAWLSWAGLPQTAIKGGRQIITLDNQRFIGAVGWRQNDQTFDSVTVTNSTVKDLSLLYGYIWNVNRIFGDNHPLGDYTTQAHLVHGDYTFAPWLKAAGYGYLMNIEEAPALSAKTFGLRLTGDQDIATDVKFSYVLEGANQADYRDNALDFSNNYYHIMPGIAWKSWTAQAGYEVLKGDGIAAFQTPLATLHAFNGWADKFLTTPVNGLEDSYGRLAYKVAGAAEWVDGTVLEAIYHDFNAENSGPDYGNEWDAQISKTFKTPVAPLMKEWSVSLKYADFSADGSAPAAIKDTTKYWLTLGTKF